MKITRQEILDCLEGMEILSITFEGVVGIHDGQVIQAGQVIDPKPSREVLSDLLHEAYQYI